MGAFRNPYAQDTIYNELIRENSEFEAEFIKIMTAYLKEVYDSRVKFLKRQSKKGMADINDNASDTHVVDRTTHMAQSANIATIITGILGLNTLIAEFGMEGHDSGHPFGSHEGEQALNVIKMLLHVGFFHHNAEGIDIVLSEDIISKMRDAALKSIKDPKKREEYSNNPEIIRRLEDDAWYFLELIVGHDGEASRRDIKKGKKEKKEFKNIEERVLYFKSKAVRENKYKAEVSTLEAAVAKPADVISYLKTDVENAFRKGIMTDFSDDYLACIADLLCTKEDERVDYEERVERGREYVQKIQQSKLRATEKDVKDPEILEIVDRIVNHIHSYGTYTYGAEITDDGFFKELSTPTADRLQKQMVNAYVQKEINKFIRKKTEEGVNPNVIRSQKHKIIDCLQKMLKIRNMVVEQVTENVKIALIDDYCQHTQKQFDRIEKEEGLTFEEKKEKCLASMGFSPKVENIIYGSKGLKALNYMEYVQYTKKQYQVDCLPYAAYDAIVDVAQALVKTGIIADKLYDPIVTEMVKDKNVKIAMNIETTPEIYNEFKNIIGIKQFNIDYDEFNEENAEENNQETISRKKTYKNIYAYTQRQESEFARTCEDTYYAIPHTIKELMKKALDTEYEPSQYVTKREIDAVFAIRKELKEKYCPNGETTISSENLKQYLQEKVDYERNENFEQNIANAIAVRYIGGFTNQGIVNLLITNGYMDEEIYKKQDIPTEQENKTVLGLVKRLEEDDKVEKNEEVLEACRNLVRKCLEQYRISQQPKKEKMDTIEVKINDNIIDRLIESIDIYCNIKNKADDNEYYKQLYERILKNEIIRFKKYWNAMKQCTEEENFDIYNEEITKLIDRIIKYYEIADRHLNTVKNYIPENIINERKKKLEKEENLKQNIRKLNEKEPPVNNDSNDWLM